MARIIKLGHGVIEDPWLRLSAADATADTLLPETSLVVPLLLWQTRREELLQRELPVGVWLAPDQHPQSIRDDLNSLQLMAIEFPVFSDGRGYSSARILRDQYGYSGELRAIGDVLCDQLFLMRRCGFDCFELRADRDASAALSRLNDFSHAYQHASVDPGAPLLMRGVASGA